MKYNFKLTA